MHLVRLIKKNIISTTDTFCFTATRCISVVDFVFFTSSFVWTNY